MSQRSQKVFPARRCPERSRRRNTDPIEEHKGHKRFFPYWIGILLRKTPEGNTEPTRGKNLSLLCALGGRSVHEQAVPAHGSVFPKVFPARRCPERSRRRNTEPPNGNTASASSLARICLRKYCREKFYLLNKNPHRKQWGIKSALNHKGTFPAGRRFNI